MNYEKTILNTSVWVEMIEIEEKQNTKRRDSVLYIYSFKYFMLILCMWAK